MKRFFVTWLISALSLIATAYLIEGIVVDGPQAAAIAALVLGLANATLRPVLSFLTLPLKCLTLGLFSFVVNAITLWAVSVVVTPGFQITDAGSALVGSLVLSVISSILNGLFNKKEKK